MDFSRYRKWLIYILTFFAYAWSGYGADILKNLRDAVLSAETIFGDFFQNAITVAKNIKTMHEVLNAAVEESCVYQCPFDVTPKPNRNHVPSSNGCGSLGIEVSSEYIPLSEMTICCDAHDICYDTCNNSKEKCDMDFKRCLYKYCNSYESTGNTIVNACKATAKMLFTGTTALGCKSYMDAQKQACWCPEMKNKGSKYSSKRYNEL